jgi:hypothetical protein
MIVCDREHTLAVLNRCWTMDRFSSMACLASPSILSLLWSSQWIQRLLVSCVVARQVWLIIFKKIGLQGMWLQLDMGLQIVVLHDQSYRKGLQEKAQQFDHGSLVNWKHLKWLSVPRGHSKREHDCEEGVLQCAAMACQFGILWMPF